MVFLAGNFFEAILNYAFLQNAFIAGVCIGVIAPLIGSVVVIRRLSFIADTLSHFSLAGAALGAVLAAALKGYSFFDFIDPLLMAMLFSVAGTFIIEKLRGFYKNYKELSMPILMSLGVGITGILITLPVVSQSYVTNLLFGSLHGVNRTALVMILIFSLLIFVFISFFYKQIVSLCFDEVYARISGVNVKMIQFIITIILALVISIFISLVGVLLISALLIIPVAASILVGKSFKGTIISSIVFSEISILLGFFLSYELNLPTGSTVVILNILILFGVMLVIKIKALIKRRLKKYNDNKSSLINNEA